jgi:hypothetical protein
MVGENRLGNVLLQMPTEKELLTQRSLRSERYTGDLFLLGKRLLTPRPQRTETLLRSVSVNLAELRRVERFRLRVGG